MQLGLCRHWRRSRLLDRNRYDRFGSSFRPCFQHSQKSFINVDQALPAGVHDPDLLQHGQHLRRLGQRFLGLVRHFPHELDQVRRPARNMDGMLGRFSRDRQYRAFHGLDHSFISSVHAALQRVGELKCVHFVKAGYGPAKSPEQLGQNYSRVPRAPISSPLDNTSAVLAIDVDGFAFISVMPAVIVKFMFVPVSPSGTGKTFNVLTCSAWRLSESAPPSTILANCAPFKERLFNDYSPS